MADNFKKLIVALDLEDKKKIEKVVKVLMPKGVKFKIGSIAFTKFGPDLVRGLIKKGADVFLDLKLYDIPNTMKETAAVIAKMGCWAFTVHAKASYEALLAVKKAIKKNSKKRAPLMLAVTELTSAQASLKKVLNLAKQAKIGGVDGVIASAKEVKAIKASLGRSLKVVTPGIRNPHEKKGDQKRVTTACQAFKKGADFIVVGRPIISKKNYLKAAKEVLNYK